MKSREGTVVDADDLVEEMVRQAKATADESGKFDDMSEEERQEVARIVGMGALKYFLLKVDARKNMLFNPEESIDFNGNTGPFIQYTYARIRSILRKAEDLHYDHVNLPTATFELSNKEQEIISSVANFAAVVKLAGKDYSPSVIANYCYELTKEYNQFYHEFSVLKEEDEAKRQFRLVLSANVAKVIRLGMGLLGIEMPERM
jgi:arginyl-tRNA synthetase